MTNQQTLQKIAAFRADLVGRGDTVASYCRRHNLDIDAMHMVLQGRTKGTRGNAHKIYVALGLKPDPTKRQA